MNKIDNFDLEAWSDIKKDKTPENTVTAADYDSISVSEQITAVARILTERSIDITEGYQAWLNLGFALADGLGESGRSIYHDLSRINSRYDFDECNRQYSACLKNRRQGITIKSFFYMAKDAGVDISEVARENRHICASCANVPSGTNSEKGDKFIENAKLREDVPSGTMAQVAQTTPEDTVDDTPVYCGQTFSELLRREDIPSFLLPIIDSQSDAVGRDKMLLGALNLISGILPKSLYGIYDRCKVYAPLYNIVYGRFATSKGDLEAVKQIVMPIKHEMRRKYEAQKSEYDEEMAQWESRNKKERGVQPKEPTLCTPFVTANSSASAVYRGLDANGGWGVMFETEADTLTNMLSKSEYGDYTDLLRKAHHHEAIAMVRVCDNINIEIEDPRMSVFLTCTGSQLPLLLPASNISNGLASRFLFYALPDSKVEFRDVFEGCDDPIEDIYKDLGKRLLPLYHALQMREQHPIQFIMTKEQKQEFVTTFDAVLREQFSMLGNGIQGFIFRMALECYRYAMILTILRRLSEWDMQDGIFNDDEQAVVCDGRDFQTAITIINCLVNHTGRVYSVLGTKDDDPFSKASGKPSADLKAFFAALPDGCEFKTCEAMEVARTLNITERTAKRFIGDMVLKYQVLGHPRHGIYVKINSVAKDKEQES